MKTLSMLAQDLQVRALTEDATSYNKLAREYGQPKVTPESFHSHAFCDAFGRLDREDLAQGRPLRTALIFSEVLNRPGNGFFKVLEERRGQTISEGRRADEWTSELKMLRDYWTQKTLTSPPDSPTV